MEEASAAPLPDSTQQSHQQRGETNQQGPIQGGNMPNIGQMSLNDSHQSHEKPERGEDALSGVQNGTEKLPAAWRIQKPGHSAGSSSLEQSKNPPEHLRRADSETGQDEDFVDAEG